MQSLLECLNQFCKRYFYLLFQSTSISTTSIGIVLIITPQTLAASFNSINTIKGSRGTGFSHESVDMITDLLYARPSSTYSLMDTHGAYNANRDYALGDSELWHIGEQRFGTNALIAGLLHDDALAIDAGLQMWDWGFAQQLEDGSFAYTGDPFHSTSLFVQSVSYGLLTLQESALEQYADIVEQYLPGLQSAARWMIQEDVWNRGSSNNRPYTHRNYLVGTALGLTGKLTGDSELLNYANSIIAQGLTLQLSDGVNPEKGGYDTSYQMAGALAAMRWLTHFESDPLARDIAEMINQALRWEESMILATGEISTEGNARTGQDQELTRSGQTKQVNHRDVVYGFAYWASMTGNSRWHDNAYQIANYYYSHDPRAGAILASIDANPDIVASTPEPSHGIAFTILLALCFLTVRKPKCQN
ncbi:MAG: hypothetical protein F6J95_027330 [Leptolyngbya sp. SIO1E4]|nr:hypothetical protein [Leptolyngbya sp. SIO1E4]